MEGMTGFNPSLAKSQINDFVVQAKAANWKLSEAYTNFINELCFYWASPVAKQFSIDYNKKIEDLVFEFGELIKSTQFAATNAYNSAAAAHGLPGISEYSDEIHIGFDCPELFESKVGAVGMNVEVVRNEVLPSFLSAMREAFSTIEHLPRSIALYDDENGQMYAYSVRIGNFITKVNETAEAIIGEIQSALETETVNILMAKQNATEAMQG